MKFWEAINSLYDLDKDNIHYKCLECGHHTRMEWAIWRHIDEKHSDKLYELSGRAHGWQDARLGWD